MDPTNGTLQDRLRQVQEARSIGQATIPTPLALELRTNPFLRPGTPGIRSVLDMDDGSEDWEVLAALRAHKDAVGGWIATIVMWLYPWADYFRLV